MATQRPVHIDSTTGNVRELVAGDKLGGVTGGTATGEVMTQDQFGANSTQMAPAGTPVFTGVTVGSIGANAVSNVNLTQSMSPAIGAGGAGFYCQPTFVEAASGVHTLFAGGYFAIPQITAGGASVTDAATVYISGAPNASGASNRSLFVFAGNSVIRDRLGVGYITAPAAVLDVVGENSTVYAGRFVAGSSATPAGVIISDAAASASGYPLLIVTDNAATTEHFRVNSGGNVGVGMSPTRKFDVTGTVGFASSNTTQVTTASAVSIAANSLTTGTGLYASAAALTSGKLMDLQVSGTAAAASQTALNILTAGANATNAITTYGARISNTHTNATSGTNVALYLDSSGATTANYGLVVNAGNSGFGTPSPQSLVQISSGASVAAAGVVQIGGGASTAYGVLVDYAAINSGRASITQLNNAGGDAATIALGFGAISGGYPTNRVMTLTQGGNVGIAMIPTKTLDVTGTFGVTGNTTLGDGANVIVGGTTGTKLATSATAQKLSVFNATPIVQPTAAGQAALAAQGQQTLTDSTAGTAGTTLAAVTGAVYATDIPTIRNWIASLAAQLALVKTDVVNLRTLVDAQRTAMVNFGSMKGS